jgi:hypothetical protein
MLDVGICDPGSTLRLQLVRYVHAFDGILIGRVVRSFFLHSGERDPDIDCSFKSQDDACKFLNVLAVEHTLTLVEEAQFGTNIYDISRITPHGVIAQCQLKIYSFLGGMKRNGQLPRNIPFPLFDIDCIVWHRDSIAQYPSKLLATDEGTISQLLDNSMQRSFSIVNNLHKRRPEAFIILVGDAIKMIENNFLMKNNEFHIRIAKSNDFCTLKNALIQENDFVIQLPCFHSFGSNELVKYVRKNSINSEIKCPVCSIPFIVKNQTVEGIV